jgi:hypothetical protein
VTVTKEEESMAQNEQRPRYESPKITAMDRDEVLQVFQMSAAQISAAGCWWAAGCAASTPCVTGNPL